MHVLKHLQLMHFVIFFLLFIFMLHKYSGANVSPGTRRHIRYIGRGKKNIKEGTEVQKNQTWTEIT